MTFRTLKSQINMENILILIFGMIFVAASMKEEATQLFGQMSKPGQIQEPLLENRQAGRIVKLRYHFPTPYNSKILE